MQGIFNVAVVKADGTVEIRPIKPAERVEFAGRRRVGSETRRAHRRRGPAEGSSGHQGEGRARPARGSEGSRRAAPRRQFPPLRRRVPPLQGARMANFFIRRPIVAIVISILIVLMGGFTLTGLADRAVPVPRAADHSRHGQLSRRIRPQRGAVRSDARRAGGERRREHDLHEVAQHERRPHAARREFHGRRQPGHVERPDAESRLVGASSPAGRR